ncbi:MAG: hypothetical protein SF123_19565 [Chloroflexota bacterium]|nr:hypothetical protein [Chloroflexota bacterium]
MSQKSTHAENGHRYIGDMPLRDLLKRRHPKNPKSHDIGFISHSFATFGYVDAVLICERTGYIAKGHGRVETLAARQRQRMPAPKDIRVDETGDWLIPVQRGWSSANDAELLAYMIADNRAVQRGGWDDALLVDALNEVSESMSPEAFSATGYDPDDLEALVKQLDANQPDTVKGNDTERGRTPDEMLETFLNNTIKQVVLYFAEAQYDSVIARMAALRHALGVESNTDLVLELMAFYENLARDEA